MARSIGRHDGGVRVSSTDHVSVAVHEFGGSGRPLLLSHATGFHGYCYLPIADALADEMTSYALDYRGHGDTARPDGVPIDWDRYGDDALAAGRAVAPNGALIGFGHSMGGACLLMAAHRDPELFDLIVVFEPIIMPERTVGDPAGGGSALAAGARRRRASFESFEQAIDNYSSKPPMMAFDADVLRLYVAHGFRPAPEGVRLKCDPETEGATFDTGGNHQTWAALPEIDVPVVVIAGDVSESGPASIAVEIAERLPDSTYVQRDDWNHFTPFIDPPAIAEQIRTALA